MQAPRDLWELVRRHAAAKGHRPAIVAYDGDGRVELSGAALVNWVAKTAGWFQEEAGVRGGDRVAIVLPPSWPAAVCLLAAWAAGARPSMVDPLRMAQGSTIEAGDVAVAVVAEALADRVPAGVPSLTVRGGFMAFPHEVLAMPDDLMDPGADAEAPAWRDPDGGPDHDQAWVLAEAARNAPGAADVLLLADLGGNRPVTGLVAALVAGASVVLAHEAADLAAIGRAERVTVHR